MVAVIWPDSPSQRYGRCSRLKVVALLCPKGQAWRVTLTINLAGVPDITVDGRPLSVDTRKAVALLAYLAVEGHPQDREHLVDLFWPDYDAEKGRATLRRTLSALRGGLGDRWIEVDRARVGLRASGVALDVVAIAGARLPHDHGPRESCPECKQALADIALLHRGDFMQGFVLKDSPRFDDWQTTQNERLRRDAGAVYDALIDACVGSGDYDGALDAVETRIELDPLNEPTYRSLMRIHSLRGDRSGVITAYRTLVATLDRELGVEPLGETSELYRALSRGAEPASPGASPAPEVRGELPFVGRTREWERLLGAYRSGSIVGIEGEPGIGKTRLVREFVGHVGALDARAVVVRAHEGETHIAYGVLTEALRQLLTSRVASQLSEVDLEELGRLLPELGAAPEDALVAGRFYEAVRAALETGLRGDRPGVLVFEDLHWTDNATLDVLAYVARRVAETGICLVCTWRSEELRDQRSVDRIVRDEPSTLIALGRFGVGDLAALLQDSDAFDDVPTSAERLLDETEGVPFFVSEYLKSYRERGTWDEVPSTVRDLLVHRLRAATGVALQVLDTAAVIDRTVDFETVCHVSGRTDLETADALDELSRTGLMRPVEGGEEVRYEFSHDKLRSVAYEEMSAARRHVLHRRSAATLIETSDPDGAAAAAIARHLEIAGDKREAAEYHARAGFWAQGVFAHSQAMDHFNKALALGDSTPEINEAIADIHVLQGSYADAINSYEIAAALTRQPESIDRKLGALYLRRGEYDLAEAHLGNALDRSTDDALTTEILVDLSLAARRRGQNDDASKHALSAVDRAASLRDPALRARAENAAGMLASARGDATSARERLQMAFDMATVADDLPAMIAALNNLALVERRDGQTDDAIDLTEQALEACRRLGDRHREAALENNLADLFHDKGDRDAAMEHLKRATAIFSEVGADPHGPLPEVWKLVEW